MFKIIKWIIQLLILILIIGGGFYVYFNYINPDSVYSEAQLEVIDNFGLPESFMITYLPKNLDENPELVRQEVWFYNTQNKKFSFLGGQITKADEIGEAPIAAKQSVLEPKDFDYYTSLEDVEKIVGKVNMAAIDAPVFFDETENIETYVSQEAYFIFEQGYLTYIQTINKADEES